jgi:tetratricopeptide (TPR) repeat protein
MTSISKFALVLVFCIYAGVPLVWSETGKVLVVVQDLQNKPVQGVEIGIEGAGGLGVSGDDGKVLLSLSKDTSENDYISLQIVHSPRGKDLEILSPYDRRALVPSFRNKAENVVKVVVIQRGDLTVLQNGTVLRAFAEQLNKKNASKSSYKQAVDDSITSSGQAQAKAELEAVAKQYGLEPDELDKAIRAWGTKTTDAYDAGLAALYERNYDKATPDLQSSLRQREEKLASDQKAVGDDEKRVADAAFFLGYSLHGQGKYMDAVVAYQRTLQVQPNNSSVLNQVGSSLLDAGDYLGAERMFRRALDIDQKTSRPENPELARSLNNLGRVLVKRGKFAEAEQLLQRSLTINEWTLGHDNPIIAANLSNLAGVFLARGQYDKAKLLLEGALAIDQKTLGLGDLEVANDLDNLGTLAVNMGNSRGAENLYREALSIREAKLGQDHPLVAITQSNLGAALNYQHKFSEAEPLLVKALALKREKLPANGPTIATTLTNLSTSLAGMGQHEEAECLLQEARSIDEEALGRENPEVATDVYNLAHLLAGEKDYAGAERLFRQALAIDEKASESEYPSLEVARDLEGLASVLEASGHYAEAEERLGQLLAIEEIVFGSADANTKQTKGRLDNLHRLSSHSTPPTTKK